MTGGATGISAAPNTASSEATPVESGLGAEAAGAGAACSVVDSGADAAGAGAELAAGGVAGAGRAWLGSKPGFGVTRGIKRSRCEPMAMRGLLADSAALLAGLPGAGASACEVPSAFAGVDSPVVLAGDYNVMPTDLDV